MCLKAIIFFPYNMLIHMFGEQVGVSAFVFLLHAREQEPLESSAFHLEVLSIEY